MNTRSERPRRRWSGPVGLAGALALAVLAVLSGADRAGASLMARGPFAQSSLAREAAAPEADPAKAAAAARALVAHAPLVSGYLSLLALREGERGQVDAATAALTAALQTGWRDPLAQALAVEWALDQGQGEVAALRAEALLRAAPTSELTRRAVSAAAGDPDTRLALARAAARGGDWPLAMLAVDDEGQGPTPAVLALVESARAQGWRPDRAEVRRGAWRLFKRDPALAWRYWTAALGPGDSARTGLWQAEFPDEDGALPEEAGPFEWRADPASTNLVSAHGGRIMGQGAAPAAKAIIGESVPAGSGTYRVHWRASSVGDYPDFSVMPVCAEAGKIVVGELSSDRLSFSRTFEISFRCRAVVLLVSASPGGGQKSWLDSIRFEQLS